LGSAIAPVAVGMLLPCYKGQPEWHRCRTAVRVVLWSERGREEEELGATEGLTQAQPWSWQYHWLAGLETPESRFLGSSIQAHGGEMGLAGGIVRRVFSKSPCSSAGGGGRAHSVRPLSFSPSVDRKRVLAAASLFLWVTLLRVLE